MGSLAPQWTKRASASHQDGGSSNGGEYHRALAEAEAALHAQKAAEFGDEWLEVYSDASVQLGSQSSEDKCGVGVWVAHKANTKGARGALVQAERSVAVHLAWEGLERVDSTVGELFGTIISVLGASTGTELDDLWWWC
jgi:hypothetical protein